MSGMMTATIGALAISGGASAYAAYEQRKAQKAANARRDAAAEAARAERDRLNRDARAPGKKVEAIDFGTSNAGGGDLSGVDEFLVPKSGNASGVGSTGSAGLGFNV